MGNIMGDGRIIKRVIGANLAEITLNGLTEA